jgi:hypothetical protein
VMRNQIFKNRGYCFNTPGAIAYFGNASCLYKSQDAVPLGESERGVILRIVSREKALGCQVNQVPPVTSPAPVPGVPPLVKPATPQPTPIGPSGAPLDACKQFPGLC